MTRSQQLRSLLAVSVASMVLTGVTAFDMHGVAQAAPVVAAGAGAGKTVAPTAPKVLPFVQDDYAGALAKARELRLPLFIETWAPW